MNQGQFIYWLKAGLHTSGGALTPIIPLITNTAVITQRTELLMAVMAWLGASMALKAYLSGNPPPAA